MRKKISFISHEILHFLDLFPSQTPCSSLSFHHRIKTKPDLESLHKTVFWNVLLSIVRDSVKQPINCVTCKKTG